MKTDLHSPAITPTAPDMVDIIGRYRKLSTNVVYDVMDEEGLAHQALASDLRPLHNDMIIAGPAFTFQGINSPEKDPDGGGKRQRMFNEMRYPCIDVRDCSFDTRVAHYGEWNAKLGLVKGAVGALIDGGLRDCRALLNMNFPVFSRYICPVRSPHRWGYHRWQVPITLRGQLTAHVAVSPGDFILGDIDGVVVIPSDRILEILRLSEEFGAMEGRAREEFGAAGDDVWEVYKRYPKL